LTVFYRNHPPISSRLPSSPQTEKTNQEPESYYPI
jgi:hypothetical protein